MQHKSFADMACPIARSLEQVGEWWSILILRDAFAGLTRFDEFQTSLGIAPNMLTRRLGSLVAAGMLERHRYSLRPPRDEYRLSTRGREFRTVLLALLAFGQKHFAADHGGARLVDTRTGETVEPMLVDRRTGEPLTEPDYRVVRGDALHDRGGGTRLPPAAVSPEDVSPADGGLLLASASASASTPTPARQRRRVGQKTAAG